MLRRPRILVVVAVVAALVAVVVVRHDGSGFRRGADVRSVTARIAAAVPDRMAAAHVPGAAVAVVRRGRVVWARGFGVARAGRPVDVRTRFQVGSLSKPVTAWATVHSGVLALDARVRPWPLAGSGAGVTPRRLLSHTAGLSVDGYLGVPPGRPIGSTADSLRGDGGEGPASAVRVEGPAGKAYRYSGGGYTVLQDAIERRSGRPFAAWAAGAVLRPLGMRASAFAWPPGTTDVAAGHDGNGHALPGYRYAELAAAGLTSSAADMGRFAAALQRDPGPLAVPQPGTDGHYGLGLDVKRLGDGTRVLFHEGINRGWHARLLVYPGRDWAAVVLTNGDGGRAVADAVQDAFEH